jgi:hypothetical protein
MTVFADYGNITCKNFNTEGDMRWRLVLEEFGPDLQCIEGERNFVADAPSRLEIDDEQEIGVMRHFVTLAQPEQRRPFASILTGKVCAQWPSPPARNVNFVKKQNWQTKSKLPAKAAEENPWDTLCVDLIGPCKIERKGKKD